MCIEYHIEYSVKDDRRIPFKCDKIDSKKIIVADRIQILLSITVFIRIAVLQR